MLKILEVYLIVCLDIKFLIQFLYFFEDLILPFQQQFRLRFTSSPSIVVGCLINLQLLIHHLVLTCLINLQFLLCHLLVVPQSLFYLLINFFWPFKFKRIKNCLSMTCISTTDFLIYFYLYITFVVGIIYFLNNTRSRKHVN